MQETFCINEGILYKQVEHTPLEEFFWMKSGSEEAPQLILPTFEKTECSF